jgi:hypothetical protein
MLYQRRFARTVLADDGHKIPFPDVQVDPAQRIRFTVVAVPQIVDLDARAPRTDALWI